MEEQLISFKTAKLAKEKGFIGCPSYIAYEENGNKIYTYSECSTTNGEELKLLFDEKAFCIANPQSVLQKWLREKHKIYAYVDWHDCSSVLFKDGLPEYVEVFEHMDLERLLQEALKLIK